MTAAIVNSPVFGSLSLNADGSFAYTNANPGMTQTVTFTYQASAGGLTSNTATVTLTLPAPTPPVANDDAYSIPTDGSPLVVSAASGVLTNDTVSASPARSRWWRGRITGRSR
jgi:VCBS repeat-containing protein